VTIVTIHELPYKQIWLHDFEFISKPGCHPDVICLVARELRSGKTISIWYKQDERQPCPYDTGPESLFVNFVGNAECSCHLAKGWPLPAKMLDLSPEFRRIMNGRSKLESRGLLGALRHFHTDNIGALHKDAMRQRILEGRPFTEDERKRILDYCMSDVDALVRLLPQILTLIDLNIALYRSEFVAVSAVMEHRGPPIDMEIFPRLQDKHTWAAVRDAMVPIIDAQYGAYVKGRNGEWSFSNELFEAYLERHGITGWPRLESGKLNMRRKTFENMTRGWPELEELRQLRHARDKMRKIKLAVGPDGRNRTVLWAFQSKTSRTQPKAAEWIFSPAVWLRSLIKPEPGQAVAYIDYSSMEFMIAAALSNCREMLELYASGDPYLNFAKRVGALPPTATAESHADTRDKYKVLLLATQYGMGMKTLAGRLNTSTFEASELLRQHRGLFAPYWAWSDDWLAQALNTGVMRTVFDWRCLTGITEFNERSIRNWPIQSTGAEILRVACILCHRHGVELLAPVHDAVLIGAPIERIEADVALARECMRRASRIVLNADPNARYELRSKAKIVKYPDRYRDGRGAEIWQRVMELLAEPEQGAVARQSVGRR
jgi:hypothetical protein